MVLIENGLNYGWAALLGLIQGLTEFLPVSSSGHLALAQHLGLKHTLPMAFDVFLHLATVMVILGAFYKDIIRYWKEERNVLFYVVVGSIPTAIVGLGFKDHLEKLKEYPLMVCGALIFTAVLLFLTEKTEKEDATAKDMGSVKAFIIGIFQAIAITPGVSRSGSTIAAARYCGIRKEDAVKFSFALMVPAVLGASLLKAMDLVKNPDELSALPVGPCLLGFAVSMITGFFALKGLITIVKKNRLVYFAAYCALAGFAGLAYFGLIAAR
ncbi:MAG: undecaprenyl-diphosphate phosphatase [Planctomycetes bacterium]|nr:undecaprenyl-diphosphate phosphatase [Planctomycetota bacterium]